MATAETEAPTRAELDNLTSVFKLLSDPQRLRIVDAIARAPGGELNVTQLCGVCGQSQSAVSSHLALLRVAGVLDSRREGKHVLYSIAGGGLAAARGFLDAIA